jgi:hypothetical protein
MHLQRQAGHALRKRGVQFVCDALTLSRLQAQPGARSRAVSWGLRRRHRPRSSGSAATAPSAKKLFDCTKVDAMAKYTAAGVGLDTSCPVLSRTSKWCVPDDSLVKASSFLAGSKRYAHTAGVRGDALAAKALGLRGMDSEDSVRRALAVMLPAASEQLLLALPHDEVQDNAQVWEYTVLDTNATCDIATIGQPYRDRCDCENVFDQLKNQWRWGGFTAQDMHRSQVTARAVAGVYGWWSWRALLTRICQRIVGQVGLPTPPPTIAAPGQLLFIASTLISPLQPKGDRAIPCGTPSMVYLTFDVEEVADGMATVEATAPTPAAHHAAVIAKVQQVLDWVGL